MSAVGRLRRIRPHDLGLLHRAFRAVIRVRLLLLQRNHAQLRATIDAYPTPRGNVVPNADLTEIAWSVRAASRLVPGASCLTQASAGQFLLARRGYATVVRLSVPVAGGPTGNLAPHAWLMSGETIVLGGTSSEYDQHRPLHDFILPGARTLA